jgi:molybdate transport system substrate-binding protein
MVRAITGRMLYLLLVVLLGGGCTATSEVPVIAAASSLRAVVPALLEAWGGGELRVTYGASGTLRRQIEAGAPLDAMLFASPEPVDALIAAGLADPTTRRRAATNALVLIGPPGSSLTFETLHTLPHRERLAIGDPRIVPAGAYAQQLLEGLDLWDGLTGRLAYGGDVAMVLAYARRGEVQAAIVYATEARSIPDIAILDRADSPLAEVVVVAATDGGDLAREFLAFVCSPASRPVFERFGFGPP